LALVLISGLLGGWKSLRVELAAAQERAAFDHPDFKAKQWIVSDDGSAALALSDRADEVVAVFANGDRLVTRRGSPQFFDIQFAGSLLTLKVADILSRRIALRAADAAEAAIWMSWLPAHGPGSEDRGR
jgi:hypothetical protein